MLDESQFEHELGKNHGMLTVGGVTGTALSKSLVDNVPGVAVIAETLDGLGDVVLHCSKKSGVSPLAVGNPAWELRRPDKVVAADLLSSSLGKIDGLHALRESEGVLLWLDKLPLHRVAWSGLAKDGRAVPDLHVGCVGDLGAGSINL